MKYVTCCIDYMVSRLAEHGIATSGLSCAIIGGADVLKVSMGSSIGQLNIESARKVLKGHRIAVQFEDVGGKQGRSVTYETATGKLMLRRTRRTAL